MLEVQVAKLTDDQRKAFEERDDLEGKARYSTNSKQKAAKLALRRWTEEHDSPAWKVAERLFKTEKDLQRSARDLVRVVSETRVGLRSEDRILPVLKALREWGFVNDELTGLTHRGVLATEVNEGNPILMTELYLSRQLVSATPTEVVATLASFVVDGIPEDYNAYGNAESNVCPRGAMEVIAETVTRCRRIASASSQCDTQWETAPFWSAVLTDWMDGKIAAEIVHTYGIYEGNFMRTVLKVVNLVDEWLAMATFCGDVGMLDTLKDVHTTLLRDVVQPESIYLRL
jgi:superfamily II RNA helicase